MITTERLIIRRTLIEDASFILNLVNSEKWLLYIGDRNIHNVEAAKAMITEKMYPQFDALGFSCNTVIRKEDGVKMGTCGAYERPGLDVPDIGFAFLPEFEGKGYGFESAKAVIKHVKYDFNVPQVSAITLESNTASIKLLKKLGLRYHKMITLPNDDVELMYFLGQDT